MTDCFDPFRLAAQEMIVAHVWRGHGSALFIELGELTPSTRHDGSPGAPTGEIGIMIEWSWRIEDERSIICGSWSEDALWAPTFSRPLGQHVVDLSLFGRLHELAVSLTGDLHVASFMTAEGDPQWTLFDRRLSPHHIICCRQGSVIRDG